MENKKVIIGLLLIAFVGLVGLTIAYFSNTSTVENEFKTKYYDNSFDETFISPDNWTPGTTTSKTVIVTNTGEVDQAIRVSYTEEWKDSQNRILSLEQGTGNDAVRAAIINFDNTTDWVKVGEYYYYIHKLEPNQTTNSFISGVTFNPLIKASSENNCVASQNGVSVTCNSTGNGYDGATYKLIITIETIQFDAYNDVWTNAPMIN